MSVYSPLSIDSKGHISMGSEDHVQIRHKQRQIYCPASDLIIPERLHSQ